MPWWLGGISLFMCGFSATAFVIYSALAYQYGFVAITLFWVVVPGTLIGAHFFASRWRQAVHTSPLEYIENRYGNNMRQSLVWLGILSRMFDDSLKLFAIGTVISVGLGFPLKTGIVASGVIMLTYTFLGGLWGALVADFVQFIVMLAGVITLPFLTLQKVGGINSFIENAPEGFFALTTEKYSWSYIILFMIIITLQYNTAWSLVQRYYSSDSDKSARKVGYFVALLYFISPVIFFLPAMMARIYLPGIENSNEVYPIICKNVLPAGMLGLFIAGMFSATMSAVAGDFNALSSVLTNDFYKRMIKPDASEKNQMIVARINTLIVAAVTISTTFLVQWVQGSGDLFQVLMKILTLFMPPIAIPMLLGLLTKKISNAGALLGLWGGIAAGVILFILAKIIPLFPKEQYISLFVSAVTLIGVILGTKFWPTTDCQFDDILETADNKDSNNQVEEISCKSDVSNLSPLPMIGLGVMTIGLVLLVTVLTTVSNKSILSITIGASLIAVGGIFLWLGKKVIQSQVRTDS